MVCRKYSKLANIPPRNVLIASHSLSLLARCKIPSVASVSAWTPPNSCVFFLSPSVKHKVVHITKLRINEKGRDGMGGGELLVGDKGGEGRGCVNMKNKGLICVASETYGGRRGAVAPPRDSIK